ncbi:MULTISPECIES: response regulator transcription factor [unclassified Enterococcus]|uniref:response regulator transcription factor n=1 Tax=unclassified Enterococcus TaxID=2608891 RepID=UPI001551B07D|nr:MULTISPECIES: response regulator transcription factor [unclassified Enterococcus]MBS7577632.1 response regulator transcription factor [Enterococcus sp. MMGLQ5-2]MBS7584174.1 response regulator transcription factor [Enterococcus sp. MMGLQ5-1]NPD12032.1 response regulator transcription factor [Enterococcus sp. MMGLQ5-1]NPD37465.1 response regulator transcription factor [Enterococcus sp. MMGLQ5-2]
MKEKLLLITRDAESVRKLERTLEIKGYEVMVSASCLSEITKGQTDFCEAFDLVILNQAILSDLKPECIIKMKQLKTPVVVLSTLNEDENNYYLSYPISKAQLTDELAKHLKQSAEFPFFLNSIYDEAVSDQFIKHHVEVINHKLIIDGVPIVLSKKEFQLFSILTAADYNLVDNQTIFKGIWNVDYELIKQPFLKYCCFKGIYNPIKQLFLFLRSVLRSYDDLMKSANISPVCFSLF